MSWAQVAALGLSVLAGVWIACALVLERLEEIKRVLQDIGRAASRR